MSPPSTVSPSSAVSTSPRPASNGKSAGLGSSTKAAPTPPTILPQGASSTIPAWVQPDLTRLLRVQRNPGTFASRSLSLVSLPAGAIFARITSPTPATVAYSSVQASRDLHIELNCDLVYINHSCRPSLVFDMLRWEVRVSSERDLQEGDELTFFYPSTEWHMAQPFDCACEEQACKGKITGAKDMSESVLAEYWLNAHIEELLVGRARGSNGIIGVD